LQQGMMNAIISLLKAFENNTQLFAI